MDDPVAAGSGVKFVFVEGVGEGAGGMAGGAEGVWDEGGGGC